MPSPIVFLLAVLPLSISAIKCKHHDEAQVDTCDGDGAWCYSETEYDGTVTGRYCGTDSDCQSSGPYFTEHDNQWCKSLDAGRKIRCCCKGDLCNDSAPQSALDTIGPRGMLAAPEEPPKSSVQSATFLSIATAIAAALF